MHILALNPQATTGAFLTLLHTAFERYQGGDEDGRLEGTSPFDSLSEYNVDSYFSAVAA